MYLLTLFKDRNAKLHNRYTVDERAITTVINRGATSILTYIAYNAATYIYDPACKICGCPNGH